MNHRSEAAHIPHAQFNYPVIQQKFSDRLKQEAEQRAIKKAGGRKFRQAKHANTSTSNRPTNLENDDSVNIGAFFEDTSLEN